MEHNFYKLTPVQKYMWSGLVGKQEEINQLMDQFESRLGSLALELKVLQQEFSKEKQPKFKTGDLVEISVDSIHWTAAEYKEYRGCNHIDSRNSSWPYCRKHPYQAALELLETCKSTPTPRITAEWVMGIAKRALHPENFK